MKDLVALLPLYENLDLAKKSIQSLLDFDIFVWGVTDGAVDFKFSHPRFQLTQGPRLGVHANGFERIRLGISAMVPWIYLCDSDTIHLPSTIGAIETLKTVLQDGEIGSLYVTAPAYHPEIGTDVVKGTEVGITAKCPGISMLMSRATAEGIVAKQMAENFASNNHNGVIHWDLFIGANAKRCINLRRSFVEHVGNLTGIHASYRKHRMRCNDVAANIDEAELASTLHRYGLEKFVYKF